VIVDIAAALAFDSSALPQHWLDNAAHVSG